MGVNVGSVIDRPVGIPVPVFCSLPLRLPLGLQGEGTIGYMALARCGIVGVTRPNVI